MWESFKIYVSDHGFEIFVWTVVVGVLIWLACLLFGCTAHFYYVTGDIRQMATSNEQEESPALILEIPTDE